MKYFLILFFSFVIIQAQNQQPTPEETFIWRFSVSIVSSYECYITEFEKNKRDSLSLNIEEVRKEDILEAGGKYYIIRKPEPSFKGYIIWMNNWIEKNENYYIGDKK